MQEDSFLTKNGAGQKPEKIRVKIRQHSVIARLACLLIKQKDVALTFHKTIYLSHSSPSRFLKDPQWVAHELAHVRQFMQYGPVRFTFKYLFESLRGGYFNNKWERQARAQEADTAILEDFCFEYSD